MGTQEVNERAREARDYFNNFMHFEYEKLVGNGAFGIAVRVKLTGVRRSRRLIVKGARNEDAAHELLHEIDIMANLNGSAHIASVIAYNDGRRYRRRPRNFENKLYGNRETVSSRILWRIFLCLIRACVAMNYPPNEPSGADPTLEELGNTPSSGLVHADMHPGNILFGTTGDFPEHSIVPPVKLIDFGLSYQSPVAVMRNITDIAEYDVADYTEARTSRAFGREL
ncbi:hypothetical protein F5B22DRAFT_650634 [Xylaria bambusicola]|uniref:uncharacterized protein n=1 Tax=Xylaria bambusicola TaxID=326684 RepID=UPI0020085691|nr:uncharacterized protein F5B22DRAFT_650634 [Xylaria bambusicola]KAI0506521.1 hypothetical protein F5B22DRAFT_650634 [Xylaria bambusicola]